MATLVLTAVGGAIGQAVGVGAAIGAAAGALAGQSLDALLFRPGGRQGPRLSDLQVQTSRYGASVPRLYGTIRAAGTVIWSTDLQEASATEGGGKGQPSLTRYSYSASFAVALSSRPIEGIGRIWADGKLLRGSAGDFKSPIGAFRLHPGSEDQQADPLIAAAVGVDQASAYRGCAYVVLEALQLEDFGNRIPSLTFEIIADADARTVSAIASDLSGTVIGFAGEEEPALAGFAAEGRLKDALGVLTDVHDLLWRDRDGMLTLVSGTSVDRTLAAAEDILRIDGEDISAATKRRMPIEAVPVALAIRHHDPARDFQVGIQTAERPGAGDRRDEIDLPAVLSADHARALADRKLRGALRGRQSVQRAVGWTVLDLAVGDIVALGGEAGRWLVEGHDWDDMAVRLRLRAVEAGARPAVNAGASGEAVVEPDLTQGATSLAIVELPGGDMLAVNEPQLFAAATGADAGWRRAALLRFRPEFDMAEAIGRTAPRAVLGNALTVLPDGAPWRIDRRASVDVQLDNVADALVSLEDMLLLEGGNLCQIGDELLQFGRAEPIGPARYRLSRLLRGWRGTEWACGSHGEDERFVLVDPARLAQIAMTASDVGQTLELRAIGSGDAMPAEAARLVDGRAIMPPSPVHGRIDRLGSGDLAISWVRRSRLGWAWPSAAQVPLGEEQEAYLLHIVADGEILRDWEVDVPTATYPAAERAADMIAAGPASLRLEIRQRGTWGLGRPLILDLP